MSTFTDVLIVGMHFREREGVPAKSLVGNMLEGAKILLVREPDNPYDMYAIKAIYMNQHIGYIAATDAKFIAPELDEGLPYDCTVVSFETKRNNLHPVCIVKTGREGQSVEETEGQELETSGN